MNRMLSRFVWRVRTRLSQPHRSLWPLCALRRMRGMRLLDRSDKLHLGCGGLHLQGYINIDAARVSAADLRCKLRSLTDFFPRNSISEIYICHTLEHLPWRHVYHYLRQFCALLCPGGLLRVSVPDMARLMRVASERSLSQHDLDTLQGIIAGGQDRPLNLHKSFYWSQYLKMELVEAGFENIQRYSSPPHFFSDDANDASCMAFGDDAIPVSLNMTARKADD